MATDFFQRQSDAHRNTKWLVVMFGLAVIGIVGTTMLVTALIAGGMQQRDEWRHGGYGGRPFPWQVPIAAGVAALGLIGGGSLFKIAELSGGGTVVAERLGGRRVYPNTTDLVERRLLNVVEEMALASGVPVPAVFMLDHELGINAFAAGHTPSDCVVAVTRGCAQQLTRDQLQGVVAHEFSHILNGDMRLDLRLMGVLYGILLLGLTGRELLRWGLYTGGGRDRRDNGGMYLLVLGLTFMVLGFLGSLFGSLIKAAVSRQREFLADASAVQFTRNPNGIGGALKRIGAAIFGSKLISPRAAEASHMYFAEGLPSLFATHPPLEVRIRRIDPEWDGTFPPAIPADAIVGVEADGAEGFIEGAAATTARADVYAAPVPFRTVQHAANQVAKPTEVHRTYIQELLAAIPQSLVDAAHEPYGARALIFALLLDDNADVRAAQLAALQKSTEPNVFELTLQLVPAVQQLDVRAQLPLVDMALPALRALSPSQYNAFVSCFLALVQADNRLSLFEWTLHHILLRHLRPQFERVSPPQVVYGDFQPVGNQCSLLLSALARASQQDDDAAFAAGAKLMPEASVRLLAREACTLNALDQALRDLAQVAPKERARLVNACAACICADGMVNVEECELLRAVCDMLDCPMPPLVAGQEVSPSLLANPTAGG